MVTADRSDERRTEAPTGIVTISGDRLEQLGVRTLSDALTLLPGLEVSAAGDEGPQTSGVALWGLREFDAYALIVDGVPAGGAYNPNPALVPVEDIDRIEVQKGPNAVLYGQTAFAGIVQVFTKTPAAGSRLHANVTTGSLGALGGSVSVDEVHNRSVLRLAASAHRSSGWQQRAGEREERLLLTWAKPAAGGGGQMRVIGQFVDRDYGFGAPLPREGGGGAPGFSIDANYAVRDAAIRDRIGALSFFCSRPVTSRLAVVTTFSFTADRQTRIRGFLDDTLPIAHASGSALSPTELDVFEDAHLEWHHAPGGRSGLLQAGASYQFGRLEAESRLFDYTVSIANPNPPASADLPAEEAAFLNVRNFFGAYLHEQMAISSRLMLAGGARVDVDREHERIGRDRPDEAVVLEDAASHAAAGETIVLNGRTLELSPKHLFSGQVEYGAKSGAGAYLAWHAAGSRPVNRRNTDYAPGYQVIDAGLSYTVGRYEVVGSILNLTDSRHVVAESELADAQVYLNPPRRGSVELRVRF